MPDDRRVLSGEGKTLVPLVQAVLADAGMGFSDLDRIAVTVGPGAFTGVRIALAAARGFSLAWNAAVVGVTTFDAVVHGLAAGETEGRMVLAAVDSRRAEPFLQLYDAERKLLDPLTIDALDAARTASVIGSPVDPAWPTTPEGSLCFHSRSPVSLSCALMYPSSVP